MRRNTGNAAWKALSSKEPKGPTPKVRLHLTPLDILEAKFGRESSIPRPATRKPALS